jgi:asparagine N-glycosylation enzyme membrane subunit Stt3
VKISPARASTNPGTGDTNSDSPETDSPIGLRARIAALAVPAWILAIGAAALVAWIRLLPLSVGALDNTAASLISLRQARLIAATLPSNTPVPEGRAEVRRKLNQWRKEHRADYDAQVAQVAAVMKSQISYRGEDGVERIILGDMDSYHWLRMARNYLQTGTTCDALSGGECRDTYANAPVGRCNIYDRSLHIAAIVAVHRVITWFKPRYPLPASSFLVPVIAGALGVFPAFAIGARLAGPLGGLCAALLISVNPLFLDRSLGSDDDVWNIVLPLFMVWAAMEALSANRPRRQIGLAAFAGLFVGLHAITWNGWSFNYAVVLLAMIAAVLLELIGWLASRYSASSWEPGNLKRAALVTVVFYIAAGLFTSLFGGSGYFTLPLSMLKPLILASHSSAAGAQPTLWPDIFSTVAELVPQSLTSIAATMGGRLFFALSLLGLVLLVVPRWGWRLPLLALIVGSECFYWLLLCAAPPGRLSVLLLLGLPLLAAVLSDAVSRRDLSGELGAVLIILAWFFGALFIAWDARRLVMLMIPPFAVAFGVALGRVQQWADAGIRRRLPATAWIARPALFAVLAAVLTIPVWQGYQRARSYVPHMNAAWWNTLTFLRQHSPPNAIVNTWWDYGYWVKFVAARRVNNDGGSLKTHIPYWIARALDAPSGRQSAGLLRMLDCSSDATPEPEGRKGAYGKLLAYGFDEIEAQQMVSELARMGRKQAQAYLAEQKLSGSAQEDVLRSTHCDPPPAYLLLSTAMEPMSAWRFIANWDFARAYVARRARLMPPKRAIADLVSRFSYSEEQARSLLNQAQSVTSELDEKNFVEPGFSKLRSGLRRCNRAGAALTCNLNVRIEPGTLVRQLVFNPADPGATHLLAIRVQPGQKPSLIQVRPALVVIAAYDGIRELSDPNAKNPQLAVLINIPGATVRLATPDYLRSTYNNLVYLGGRYAPIFEQVRQEIGFRGERVTLWKIDWQRLEALDQ